MLKELGCKMDWRPAEREGLKGSRFALAQLLQEPKWAEEPARTCMKNDQKMYFRNIPRACLPASSRSPTYFPKHWAKSIFSLYSVSLPRSSQHNCTIPLRSFRGRK